MKYLGNITTPYSPGGPPPGYAFNWAHPGIDLPYRYEKVQTPLGGTIKTGEMPDGFGHYLRVMAKPYDAYFGHLSKWLVKDGQHVSPGDAIAISGNTGASTGPHLHFEMNKHGFGANTGHSIDPVKWLKTHNGSKGGQNKAASAWKSDIKRAAKQMHVSLSGSDINGIASLIQHESGGNAGVTQSAALKDGNYGANLAKGLLQYVPGTFNNYKVRGHGNIFNGYDQLLAFFNNRNWRSQYNPNGGWSPSGPRRYENGGISSQHQLAEISEKNRAEMVVPLHRTKRTRAIQLIEQAMSYVGMNKGKTEVTVNNDNSTVEKLLQHIAVLTEKGNKATEALAQVLKGNSNDGGIDLKKLEQNLSKVSGNRASSRGYTEGGAIV
ncbi:peptidoglycan DD-metalloendopeptidase family protein [Staphylococcus saprophyticus]|uniref:peptidoglycan DD-metalloendopeptidase family protein n=1 Tax=Staphylococcus saprophyticus TaxID=29385 RepID=UPI003977ABC8